MPPVQDTELVQIVDSALAEAGRRAIRLDGTSWLACRPGCTPCCHGVFRISALDADRLRTALGSLHITDPPRAAAILDRAQQLAAVLRPHLPGDPETGVLEPEGEAWDTFADLSIADAPCPVLDPSTGSCDLYTGRPLTCRVFGPPVQNEGGIGMCELCYVGASDAEILHGEMHLTHHDLEAALDSTYPAGETIIALALLATPQPLEGSASATPRQAAVHAPSAPSPNPPERC